ncbi:VaFE repeat-containing surface-anchored protein, partial [Corynebacterium sp. BF-R-2]|uniref:VaFE repeat-containing surface-anchored protein n=1 Tax=Corynebacterium sp. BF-R-2 TaxID=2943494 RepID=UPI00211ED1D6
MNISRSLPRRGWTLLTAILATIAVIAALLTVPWGNAGAAEPTDFKPDDRFGLKEAKDNSQGTDETWDGLVWAGTPSPKTTAKNANADNNVGWAWCIEPAYGVPYETDWVYKQGNAKKLNFDDPQYRDAAIILAQKMQSAIANEDYKAASTYRTYLIPFVARDKTSRARAATTITGEDPKYTNKRNEKNFPQYDGKEEEFEKLTGYTFVPYELYGKRLVLKKIPGAKIPQQPSDLFITVVRASNPGGSFDDRDSQTVMPVDQPGLPDENGGSGSNPSTLTPSIGTKAEFAEDSSQPRVVNGATVEDTVTYKGLVAGKKYHLDAKLVDPEDPENPDSVYGTGEADFVAAEGGEGSAVVTIKVDNAEKPVASAVAFERLTSVEVNADGDETPGVSSDKPNDIAQHENPKDEAQTVTSKETLTPSIGTKAEFAEDSSQPRVVNGATVEDTVTYKGLVAGKKY